MDDIIALATKQAEILAAETRQSLKEHVERRIRLAEEKIARAETEAVKSLAGAKNLADIVELPSGQARIVKRT